MHNVQTVVQNFLETYNIPHIFQINLQIFNFSFYLHVNSSLSFFLSTKLKLKVVLLYNFNKIS